MNSSRCTQHPTTNSAVSFLATGPPQRPAFNSRDVRVWRDEERDRLNLRPTGNKGEHIKRLIFKVEHENNKKDNVIRTRSDSNNIKAPGLEELPVWLSSFSLLISLVNRENSGSTATLGGPENTDSVQTSNLSAFAAKFSLYQTTGADGTFLAQLVIDASITPLVASTCGPPEENDPDCCQESGSTDAEPRQQARPPRSPRRAHPASSRAPVRTCRGLLTLLPAVSQPPLKPPAAALIYRLGAVLSAGSIGGTEPEVRPVISTAASRVRGGIRTRHPQQLQPAGTDEPPVPPR